MNKVRIILSYYQYKKNIVKKTQNKDKKKVKLISYFFFNMLKTFFLKKRVEDAQKLILITCHVSYLLAFSILTKKFL